MIWDKLFESVPFTENDIVFLREHFRVAHRNENEFYFALADPTAMKSMLDDESLHRRLLESNGTVAVSARLYFYIVLNRAFKEAGLNDQKLVEFLALALEERTSGTAPSSISDAFVGGANFYSIDVFEQLSRTGDAFRNFKLLVSVGNHLLFLTGLFPSFLKNRETRRGAPGLHYYENFGRSSYLNAAGHPLAEEFDMRGICTRLANRFSETRQVLNEVAETILFLD